MKRLEEQSGGFGAYLHLAHNWADWEATKKSYELFARFVAPKFQGLNENRVASVASAQATRPETMAQHSAAISARIASHVAEKGADTINPGLLKMAGLGDTKKD
jgi:limonene 1,2-monooxygenase